jgi:hypothetical protein
LFFMEVAFKTLYKHLVSPDLEYTSFNHHLRRFTPFLLLVPCQYAYRVSDILLVVLQLM